MRFACISICIGSKGSPMALDVCHVHKTHVRTFHLVVVTRDTKPEHEFSTRCQKLHNIHAATLPTSNSTIREFGAHVWGCAVGRETLNSSDPSPEQITADLGTPCWGDVNLRECSVGRVYIGVYNYIWRDIKRRRNRAGPMNDVNIWPLFIVRPSLSRKHELQNRKTWFNFALPR